MIGRQNPNVAKHDDISLNLNQLRRNKRSTFDLTQFLNDNQSSRPKSWLRILDRTNSAENANRIVAPQIRSEWSKSVSHSEYLMSTGSPVGAYNGPSGWPDLSESSTVSPLSSNPISSPVGNDLSSVLASSKDNSSPERYIRKLPVLESADRPLVNNLANPISDIALALAANGPSDYANEGTNFMSDSPRKTPGSSSSLISSFTDTYRHDNDLNRVGHSSSQELKLNFSAPFKATDPHSLVLRDEGRAHVDGDGLSIKPNLMTFQQTNEGLIDDKQTLSAQGETPVFIIDDDISEDGQDITDVTLSSSGIATAENPSRHQDLPLELADRLLSSMHRGRATSWMDSISASGTAIKQDQAMKSSKFITATTDRVLTDAGSSERTETDSLDKHVMDSTSPNIINEMGKTLEKSNFETNPKPDVKLASSFGKNSQHYDGSKPTSTVLDSRESHLNSVMSSNYESDLDESIMWAASQYLYIHMRAVAASSIFGVEVDVEWSNERINLTSIDIQHRNNSDEPGSSSGSNNISWNPSIVSYFDTIPFATIDVISGQSLLLQCTGEYESKLFSIGKGGGF